MTSHRGVSGFDNYGHGHYYANYPNSHHNSPAQPSLPQSNPHQQAPPRPFPQSNGHHDTSSGHQQQQQQQQNHHPQQQHHPYDSDSFGYGGLDSSGGGGGGGGGKGYDNNWHYLNSPDRNNLQQGYGGGGGSVGGGGGQGGHHGGQHGYGGSHSNHKDTSQRYVPFVFPFNWANRIGFNYVSRLDTIEFFLLNLTISIFHSNHFIHPFAWQYHIPFSNFFLSNSINSV